MAPETQALADVPSIEALEDDPTLDWYDRSSLPGDFLVMIADQTEEDYRRRVPESRLCEFIDGVVYMHAAAETQHQFDVIFLISLLYFYNARREVGILLAGPGGLRVQPGRILQPDLFVLPIGGDAQVQDAYCDPPALCVVEVLSNSTRSHDLNRKRALYREASVAEIVFIDRRDKVIIVDRRAADGYESTRLDSGPLVFRSLDGFWVDIAWFWTERRPNAQECLDRILAGPPA